MSSVPTYYRPMITLAMTDECLHLGRIFDVLELSGLTLGRHNAWLLGD